MLLTMIIGGCSSVGVQTTREAKLMPAKVAKQVLAKYFGDMWVENPTGTHLEGPLNNMICGKGQYPMPFNTITSLLVSKSGHKIHIAKRLAPYPKCGEQIWVVVERVDGFTQEDLDDIADALVSLGAQIKEIEYK